MHICDRTWLQLHCSPWHCCRQQRYRVGSELNKWLAGRASRAGSRVRMSCLGTGGNIHLFLVQMQDRKADARKSLTTEGCVITYYKLKKGSVLHRRREFKGLAAPGGAPGLTWRTRKNLKKLDGRTWRHARKNLKKLDGRTWRRAPNGEVDGAGSDCAPGTRVGSCRAGQRGEAGRR